MPGSIQQDYLPLCENCNTPQDDYERDIRFASKDSQGGETSCPTPARAKFDTGLQRYNLLSKEFLDIVHEGSLGDFEEHAGTPEWVSTERHGLLDRSVKRRSLWGSCKLRFRGLYQKSTGRRPLPGLITVDSRSIKVVGILRNTCWRGINLDQTTSGQMIRFPGKFIRTPPFNEFLVVENLWWDVVFGLPTINQLQHTTPFGCVPAAGALAKAPEDTGDREKYEQEKMEHAKIIEDQNRKKREAARREGTSKTNEASKSK